MSHKLYDVPDKLHDVPLEKIVLGTLLSENNDITQSIKSILQAEHFYNESHQCVAQAIADLNLSGHKIDVKLIGITLKQRGKLELVGGFYGLSEILNNAANSVANLEIYYCHLIELWMRRELIALAQNILGSAYDETVDVFSIVDSTNASIQKINPYSE